MSVKGWDKMWAQDHENFSGKLRHKWYKQQEQKIIEYGALSLEYLTKIQGYHGIFVDQVDS